MAALEPSASLLPAAPRALAEAAREAVARAGALGRPVLLSWTREADAADPLAFLGAGAAPRCFFAAPGGAACAGSGAEALLEARGAARFDAVRLRAEALFRDAVRVGSPGAPAPRLLGGFAFADGHEPEGGWEGFPAALFALPSVALALEAGRAWVTVNRLVGGREEPPDLARHMAHAGRRATAGLASEPPEPAGVPLPPFGSRVLERAEWLAGVRRAVAAVQRGELRKVVVARRFPVPLTGPLGATRALARLGGSYPECFRFLVEPRTGRLFLGASPELLVRLDGARVASAAVAGSAPRGADAEEDEALARALLASPKERREHAIVAEHLRARLRGAGASLDAGPEAPAVLRLRNVQHLHTPLRGSFAARPHVLDLVAALHPSPAVAGAPPREALAFLAREESFARGWYAGAVGWFDAAGQGEFAAALRCALVEGREAWLFAGAGIVAGAEPEREWDETLLKLEPMLEALGAGP